MEKKTNQTKSNYAMIVVMANFLMSFQKIPCTTYAKRPSLHLT